MTWRRSVTVWCDHCADVISTADLGDETVAAARNFAKREGHHVADHRGEFAWINGMEQR